MVGDGDYSGRRVLLVEDNELNLEIATELLSMTGVAVDAAQNGREAVWPRSMAQGIRSSYRASVR